MGHRDRQYHQEYGIGNFKAEPGALHQHSDGHFHPAEREQTISVLHPAHGCHQGRDFTAPANQRQHVGAGLSFHVIFGQLPACTAFQYRQQKNNARIARWIVEQAAALGFKNYIHLIDTDIYRSRYLKEYIHPAISIYYRRDYVIGEAYWRRHGTRLEPELAASADLVLANSTRFAAELQAYNPHTYPIETGVNLTLYNPAKEYGTPDDVQNIPHPIIGYMGTINSTRLDGELLYQIISQRPDYSFVFTGPEDDGFRQHRIHSLKNAYFTGQKKVDELPAYITAYDVCINPQMVNDITDGNYPLKIDEYLAMGKPTVATSTHTMRHIFADHTHLATNPEEWLSAIDRAVTEADDKELAKQRIAFAETHSWGHSVKKIYGIIDNF